MFIIKNQQNPFEKADRVYEKSILGFQAMLEVSGLISGGRKSLATWFLLLLL